VSHTSDGYLHRSQPSRPSCMAQEAMTGRRASGKEVWSTVTRERPNASKVSAASLWRTVIQRFGVKQNSTQARYALNCEFSAALGTRTSRPTDIHVVAVDPASTPGCSWIASKKLGTGAQHCQRALRTTASSRGLVPKWPTLCFEKLDASDLPD
jgi:hypothetical protein